MRTSTLAIIARRLIKVSSRLVLQVLQLLELKPLELIFHVIKQF